MSALRSALRWPVARRNLLIALVVGTVLTAVNQWEVLVRQELTNPLIARVFANYLIPFVVSTVSAAVNCGAPPPGAT